MKPEELRELLARGLNRYQRKLFVRLVEECAQGFISWLAAGRGSLASLADESGSDTLLDYLVHALTAELDVYLSRRSGHAEFRRHLLRAPTSEEREQHILDYARTLGAGDRDLAEDRRAFARYFDAEAVIERFEFAQHSSERRLAWCLDRIGLFAAESLSARLHRQVAWERWQGLALEDVVKPFLVHEGDVRVSFEAFRCLRRAIEALPREMRENILEESTLQFIYRSALQGTQNTWIQCEAIALLGNISRESFAKVLSERLTRCRAGDDIFVRRRAVSLLGENLPHQAELEGLLEAVAGDPSEFVRQGLPRALLPLRGSIRDPWLKRCACEDRSAKVRAQALVDALRLARESDTAKVLLAVIAAVLRREGDEFVLRTAFYVIERSARRFSGTGRDGLAEWFDELSPLLNRLAVEASSTRVRRFAAQTREYLWSEWYTPAKKLKEMLRPRIVKIRPGSYCSLSKEVFAPYDEDTIGRILGVLSRGDFTLDLQFGRFAAFLSRGDARRFSLWRLLHELRTPAPDKRQAVSHTIGRIYYGSIRARSPLMGELSETRVPGEPLFFSEEGDCRSFLPLVDDVLSFLHHGGGRNALRLYSPEGVTELSSSGALARFRAADELQRCFAEYAGLRNWRPNAAFRPNRYVEKLRGLGVQVEFTPHDAGGKCDSSITAFFLPALFPARVGQVWLDLKEYFPSIYENSLAELAVFTGAMMIIFGSLHLYENIRLKAARKRLPLVVGGWGTRGKSGSERLKAALFNALGFGVLSKTTGCEAMIVHAPAFGQMAEMLIYRPYDKATIWEQASIVRLASCLQSDVFLWECMGLQPEYVQILQQRWMRDDLSTITNTYPDHEDLQGPAGVDVAEAIGSFIPINGRVFTAEEQMLPVLRAKAAERESELHNIGWLEAGLLTQDVLERFPYSEHPANVALVLRLAEEIGLVRDYALKEMADRVVPDLGVLKTFPQASIRGRRLEFTNGMSANERIGTLSNWERTGFASHEHESDPATFLTTVVNNRADRVSRSVVFARILADDLSADRHFLIGGNLKGLQGYIDEAWSRVTKSICLWRDESEAGNEAAVNEFRRLSKWLRVARSSDIVRERLRIMLVSALGVENCEHYTELWDRPDELEERLRQDGFGVAGEEVSQFHRCFLAAYQEFVAFLSKLHQAAPEVRPSLTAECRELLTRWFKQKFVVIENYYATVEEIVDILCRETPPGFLNRIM